VVGACDCSRAGRAAAPLNSDRDERQQAQLNQTHKRLPLVAGSAAPDEIAEPRGLLFGRLAKEREGAKARLRM
jgi:hypothetical protein